MFSIRAKQRPIPSISASNSSKIQFYICFRSFVRIFCLLSMTSVSPAQIAPYYFLSMPKPHLLQLLQLSLQPTSTKVLINASPTCLRQHPSLFFQDFSRHVNDAYTYRTAISCSHINKLQTQMQKLTHY